LILERAERRICFMDLLVSFSVGMFDFALRVSGLLPWLDEGPAAGLDEEIGLEV
jgi:hypothetical protein